MSKYVGMYCIANGIVKISWIGRLANNTVSIVTGLCNRLMKTTTLSWKTSAERRTFYNYWSKQKCACWFPPSFFLICSQCNNINPVAWSLQHIDGSMVFSNKLKNECVSFLWRPSWAKSSRTYLRPHMLQRKLFRSNTTTNQHKSAAAIAAMFK